MAFAFLFNLCFTKKIKMAFATIICLGFLVLVIPSFHYNFAKTLSQHDITIIERGKYWNVTWNMIKKHPLLGIGVNTYHAQFPSYTDDPTVKQTYPHNSYLQMTGEIGIPGALIFLFALFYLLWHSARKSEAKYYSCVMALRIALMAFLIQGFFDNNLYALQTASLFWVFWGVFAGLVFSKPETIQAT